MKTLLILGLVSFVQLATADIKSPSTVNCTVTKVTPEEARFFGFAPGPTVGDKITQDLNAAEILRLEFASGAVVGSTVIPHPLIKAVAESWEGASLFEAKFQSTHTRHDYHARLIAMENDASVVKVTLDVSETPRGLYQRISLNSLEMDCVR